MIKEIGYHNAMQVYLMFLDKNEQACLEISAKNFNQANSVAFMYSLKEFGGIAYYLIKSKPKGKQHD